MDISPINQSEIGLINAPTERVHELGHHLVGVTPIDQNAFPSKVHRLGVIAEHGMMKHVTALGKEGRV